MKWENKTVHLLKINYMWWGWEKKKGWSPATCKYPSITGFFPGPPEKGGLEPGPTRTKIRVPGKRSWRPFDQIPTAGQEKIG